MISQLDSTICTLGELGLILWSAADFLCKFGQDIAVISQANLCLGFSQVLCGEPKIRWVFVVVHFMVSTQYRVCFGAQPEMEIMC